MLELLMDVIRVLIVIAFIGALVASYVWRFKSDRKWDNEFEKLFRGDVK